MSHVTPVPTHTPAPNPAPNPARNPAPTYARVLVTAASGKTGRRLVPMLESAGVEVRRGSRSGAPAFDWDRPETWGPALEGMDAAYIAYTPDLAVPRAADDLTRFVEIARERGVRKLVLLSGRGEPEAEACERIVRGSGLAWTVVRAGWFNQNFSEGEFAGMVGGGVITLPNPDAREPFVDADDIAEVAAASLTRPGHDGEVYEVTGPELLTMSEVAAVLSDATGRSIEYRAVPSDQFLEELGHAGMPAGMIELLGYLFEITASGVNARVTDGVERALGRPPKSFREYARGAVSDRAWAQSAAGVGHG